MLKESGDTTKLIPKKVKGPYDPPTEDEEEGLNVEDDVNMNMNVKNN